MDIAVALIQDVVRRQQTHLQREKLVNPPPKKVLNQKSINQYLENEKPKWWDVSPVEYYT